jgi:hypothetical protein
MGQKSTFSPAPTASSPWASFREGLQTWRHFLFVAGGIIGVVVALVSLAFQLGRAVEVEETTKREMQRTLIEYGQRLDRLEREHLGLPQRDDRLQLSETSE